MKKVLLSIERYWIVEAPDDMPSDEIVVLAAPEMLNVDMSEYVTIEPAEERDDVDQVIEGEVITKKIKPGKTLAIVGSRDPFDPRSKKFSSLAYARAVEVVNEVLVGTPDVKIISGGARGIDTLAEKLAKGLGIEFEGFLPKTTRWYDGFKPRNDAMAAECDAILRIAASTTTTGGSAYTLNAAIDLNKDSYEIIIDSITGEIASIKEWIEGKEVD